MKDNFEDYESFMDECGTIFQKVDDEFYDYKLIDDLGIDYCTISQMKVWNVKVNKKLILTKV